MDLSFFANATFFFPDLGKEKLCSILVFGNACFNIIMRQGRGSEATEAVFCLQAKKPLPSGSYERRLPKIKIKIIFLYQGCLSL